MKHWLKSLFSENGDVSMARVMSLLSLLIGGYLALTGHDADVSIFVWAAFTGKVASKIAELNPKTPPSNPT